MATPLASVSRVGERKKPSDDRRIDVSEREFTRLQEDNKRLREENLRLRLSEERLQQIVIRNAHTTKPAIINLPTEIQDQIKSAALRHKHVVGVKELKHYLQPDPEPDEVIRLPSDIRAQYLQTFLGVNIIDVGVLYHMLCNKDGHVGTTIQLDQFIETHKVDIDVPASLRSLSWRVPIMHTSRGAYFEDWIWGADFNILAIFPLCVKVEYLELTFIVHADTKFFNGVSAEHVISKLDLVKSLKGLRKLKFILVRVEVRLDPNARQQDKGADAAEQRETWSQSVCAVLSHGLDMSNMYLKVKLDYVTTITS